jgi:Undecaprenyl-phosphate galactose phosphotransferase WbaP
MALSQSFITHKSGMRRLPLELSLLIASCDAVAMLLGTICAAVLHAILHSTFGIEDSSQAKISYYAMFCCIILMICAIKGCYSQRFPWWSQIHYLVKITLALCILDICVTLSLELPFSALKIATFWTSLLAFLIAGRYMAGFFASKSPLWKVPVVLVGDAAMVYDSTYALYADGMTGYTVEHIVLNDRKDVTIDMSMLPASYANVSIHYDTEICDFIKANPDYFYVVGFAGFRGERRDALLETLEGQKQDYAIIPATRRLHLYGMEPHYFFGSDILLLQRSTRLAQNIARIGKRIMDILGASCALIPLGLLTLGVWVMKRKAGIYTPLFYGGKRVGLHGELFPCWKFQTMHPDADQKLQAVLDADPEKKAEWDVYQKLKDDPRIDSSVSAFLRKTSLDEIPQLWNVFVGDMSLVGPRPILPNQQEQYGKDYEHYTSVRPGITGLWQVSGRNETTFEQRLVWDYWYIKNWSLWHDIVILTKTIRVFLTGSGAY